MIHWEINENNQLKDRIIEEENRLKENYLIDINKIIKQYESTKTGPFDIDALWKALLSECYNYFPFTGSVKEFPITDSALFICAYEYSIMSAFLTSIVNDKDADKILGHQDYGDIVKSGKVALYSIFRKDEASEYINISTVDNHKADFSKSEFGYNFWKSIGGSEADDKSFSQIGGFDLMFDTIYAFSIWSWKTNPYNDILSFESEKFYKSPTCDIKEVERYFNTDNKARIQSTLIKGSF